MMLKLAVSRYIGTCSNVADGGVVVWRLMFGDEAHVLCQGQPNIWSVLRELGASAHPTAGCQDQTAYD